MTKAAKKTTEEAEEEEAEDLASAPLFAAVNRAGKRIDRVSVRRLEPNSGFMGIMPAAVTEEMIFAKFGGGDYRLEAKNDAGGILKVRAYKIAGDPQFASEAEERTWRRQNGLDPKTARGGAGSDVKEMLAIMEERDDKRRAELLEREERTRKDADAREDRDRRQREERDTIARREEEAREERRRRESREDDERRTRAHREDLERISAQNAAALAQSQQYFTQLAASMKADERSSSAADPVKTLITGIQLARDLGAGGGGEGTAAPVDFLTALVSRLPETLQEVRRTAGAALSELKGSGGGKRPAGLKPGEDFLTITGKTATKAKALAMKIRAAGGNPEKAIDQMLTMATASVDAAAPATPAGAIAPPPRASTKAATQVRSAAKIARHKPRPPAARRGAGSSSPRRRVTT
jgi:hypothetical protein